MSAVSLSRHADGRRQRRHRRHDQGAPRSGPRPQRPRLRRRHQDRHVPGERAAGDAKTARQDSQVKEEFVYVSREAPIGPLIGNLVGRDVRPIP